MKEALQITVTGIVQGVGFRPFVYCTAERFGLSGWVKNATDAVHIHVEGESGDLDAFVMELSDHAPAAARIKEITLEEQSPSGCAGFEIVASDAAEAAQTTLVSADLCICEDCAKELFDPNDRRYRYPFINCTNCGPRFTIMHSLPYDRAVTTMADFAMCPECAQEYSNPRNRRFHAQPDACFECGPSLMWATFDAETRSDAWQLAHNRAESDALLARAVALLREGGIVAVKGLGGFHLVCDAENETAIANLRTRKRREGKPFAVMLENVTSVRAYCHVSEDEAAVLSGVEHPIVLLKKRSDVQFCPGLADDLVEMGVMLPYTPVQMLLMHDFVQAGGKMLVMTSANIHDEPIVTSDEEARTKLAGIADAVLGNNREICARYDDSVVRVLDFGHYGAALQVVRRARGFAPVPLKFPASLASETSLLAVGPEQKNTFCLARNGADAFVSQHMGDLESAETYTAWLSAQAHYQKLFQLKPQLLACDKHPEYLASKWAHEQALSCVEVQHHHAHIAAVLAENNIEGAALGIAFDGTGYGEDGHIWGGEALVANMGAFERFANFSYEPMPGGAAAIKQPLRMAYGVLWACDLLEHPAAQRAFEGQELAPALLDAMIEQGINTPYTSSVGRLFDAASALLGICVHPQYEGEGAVLLEAAIARSVQDGGEQGAAEPDTTAAASSETAAASSETAAACGNQADARYSIAIVKNTATETSTAQDTSIFIFDPAPCFKALLDDVLAGVPTPVIACKFHHAFVEVIVNAAELFRALYDLNTIALSGGVFMNRYLMEHAVPQLVERGFHVALNKELPPNDGSISYGQAVVVYAQEQANKA